MAKKLRETARHDISHVTGCLRGEQENRRLAIDFREIKAVIYDKDDLMVRSEPLHAQAWNVALSNYGTSRYEDICEDVRKRWVGRKEIYVAQIIIGELGLGVKAEELLRQKSIAFNELTKDRMETLPGLLDSLDFFKNKGFRIGLVTSSSKESIDLMLDKFNIRRYFDVTLSGADVKLGKPDPEVYLLAAEKLGRKPRECVVLEDAQNGIEAAKAAGCWCIGVINLDTPPQDRSKADMILNSLEEVTGLGFKDLYEQVDVIEEIVRKPASKRNSTID